MLFIYIEKSCDVFICSSRGSLVFNSKPDADSTQVELAQSSISFRVRMSRLSWPILYVICVWSFPLQGLPARRCESFPAARQLKQLNVSGCALAELQFATESELQWLDASHNELRQLTKDQFDRLPELVYANLSHNSLNHLEALQLLQLQRLQLDHNELTNLGIGLCPRLLELSLNDNELRQVSHVQGTGI